jgi:uridine kinase
MIRNQEKGIENLKKLNLWRRYQSTLSFILYVALKKLFPGNKLRIQYSIGKGFYFLLEKDLSHDNLLKIEKMMKKIIKRDLPIKKAIYSKREVLKIFKNIGLQDKVNVFLLEKFPPGYIMMFPFWQDLSKLPRYIPQPRLQRIFNEYEKWANILGIKNVGQLNYAIKKGKESEIVKVTEALHEKKIVYIADRIVKEKKKIILIAGPSSAGKTTFTKRLAIQLLVNGIKPFIISADDYFLPHSQTPKDEFSNLDFESINAVDVSLLNQQLLKTIKGKKVNMPKFNFLTGRRNKGKVIVPSKDGVILLEGIHCLNEAFTYKIPKSIKFKIYISALTQLNIDDHNRISTTDTRMLRRIVRDTLFRGYKIKSVLQHWSNVRIGEEKNIYPYQEEADEMFNSALMYEPAVLKKFCLPIMKRIKKTMPEYEEAKRLIDFLNLFYEFNERDVPSNSILREFIGGSSFVY